MWLVFRSIGTDPCEVEVEGLESRQVGCEEGDGVSSRPRAGSFGDYT